jgi:hypothetical protein
MAGSGIITGPGTPESARNHIAEPAAGGKPYRWTNFLVAKYATPIPAFALAISTGVVMLQMRTEFAVATRRQTMRNLILMVLPIFAAASLSGLMFTATLA